MTELPTAVREAGSVLISGPPMSGKYHLFNHLLAAWSDESVIISTGRAADRVRSDYERLTGHDPSALVVIDCVTLEQGEAVADTTTTKYVASAGNLTDIGVKFTDLVESSAGIDRAVGIHSLSQLMMYWDPERIYQFTRVMTSQASGVEWPLVGVVGSTTHDEQAIHTLHEPFELVVETRIVDDSREFRARGMVGEPTDWTSF